MSFSGSKIIGIYFLFAILVLQCTLLSVPASGSKILGPNRIKDQKGRIVEVDDSFQRIISLYGAHTENLYSLGLEDRIAGVSINDDYPPQVENKQDFSYHDGLEKFLAAKPDLVLIRPMIDRGYARLISRLEKSGITVVSLQPNTVQEMKTYWKILGILAGKQEKSRSMVRTFEQGIDYISQKTSRIEEKKKVYFESIHSKMKTFAPDAIAVYALQKAGGIHIARDADQVKGSNIARYSKERILAKASEIDVYLAQKGPMNQITKDRIRKEPGFDIIKAVKNDQIHIVEEKIVSRPTLRILLGIREIGGYLYPNIFDREVHEHINELLSGFQTGIQ